MMNNAKLACCVIFILASNLLFAQGNHYILALSKAEKKMFVLDNVTLDTITKIQVGDDPHEVVTSADGSMAYVSNPLMNNSGHEINVINLQTLQPEKSIDTRPFYIPHGLVYNDNKLWFTAQGSKSVVVYDLINGKAEEVFGTGQDFTHLLYLASDGNRFYTTNVESGTVSIFEKRQIPPYMPPTGVLPPNAKPRLEWRQTLVDAGFGCEGFDVSKDGNELWTARPDGVIVIIDLLKKQVKTKINTNVQGLHRLRFTPDGKTVCVVSVKTGDLLFYNVSNWKLERKINVGKGAGIYMDAYNNRMFISCTPNNYIVVMDLTTRKEIKRIDIGRPDGITSVFIK